jgi:hypothetical protein
MDFFLGYTETVVVAYAWRDGDVFLVVGKLLLTKDFDLSISFLEAGACLSFDFDLADLSLM